GLIIGFVLFKDLAKEQIQELKADNQHLTGQMLELEAKLSAKYSFWEETEDGFLAIETPDLRLEIRKNSLPQGLLKKEGV
ncbi:MAG: hypothetical protein AAB392_00235, partial [Patescibacteria group bacterium]